MNIERLVNAESFKKLKWMAEQSMGPARVFMHSDDYAKLGSLFVEERVRFSIWSKIYPPRMTYRNTTFQVVPDWEQGVVTLAHYGE